MQSVIKQIECDEASPFRLAYSHHGFLTFKSDFPTAAWSSGVPRGPFIRLGGHILSKLEGEDSQSLISKALGEVEALGWTHVHVWEPDSNLPGRNGFEPGPTLLVQEIANTLREHLSSQGDSRAESINQNAPRDAKVVDLIIEQPGRWWIGTHKVTEVYEGWPGGVPSLTVPLEMVSRAYLKAAETVLWSQVDFKPKTKLVEIGSSPGGSCQYYLERDIAVTGVDPADMDESLMKHPKFTHVRSRAISLKRRFFSGFRYLACDANVAPNYTLDTVEAIVTHESSRCKYVFLTIKLKEPEDALKLPEYLERVSKWGFKEIQARQLAYNRREVTLFLSR